MVGALLNPLSGRSLKGFVLNLRRSAEGSVADLDLDEGAVDSAPETVVLAVVVLAVPAVRSPRISTFGS
jgi:hypothetical protein